jgi:hypothetical protein
VIGGTHGIVVVGVGFVDADENVDVSTYTFDAHHSLSIKYHTGKSAGTGPKVSVTLP